MRRPYTPCPEVTEHTLRFTCANLQRISHDELDRIEDNNLRVFTQVNGKEVDLRARYDAATMLVKVTKQRVILRQRHLRESVSHIKSQLRRIKIPKG